MECCFPRDMPKDDTMNSGHHLLCYFHFIDLGTAYHCDRTFCLSQDCISRVCKIDSSISNMAGRDSPEREAMVTW